MFFIVDNFLDKSELIDLQLQISGSDNKFYPATFGQKEEGLIKRFLNWTTRKSMVLDLDHNAHVQAIFGKAFSRFSFAEYGSYLDKILESQMTDEHADEKSAWKRELTTSAWRLIPSRLEAIWYPAGSNGHFDWHSHASHGWHDFGFILYLNDLSDKQGGETVFHVNGQDMAVQPRLNRLVLFRKETMHKANACLDDGKKTDKLLIKGNVLLDCAQPCVTRIIFPDKSQEDGYLLIPRHFALEMASKFGSAFSKYASADGLVFENDASLESVRGAFKQLPFAYRAFIAPGRCD